MSAQYLLIFATTVLVASLIPGPSMLLALSHGMQHGIRTSVVSALGNLTATMIQASISFAGLGAILVASETAFLVIKWLGAGYLVFMGISILRSSSFAAGDETSSTVRARVTNKKIFLESFTVAAGNPKAIVFFTAVFPQFINPNFSYPIQFLVLTSIGATIAFSCYMLYAISGQKIMRLFAKSDISKYFQRIVGGTFIGAGIGLASSSR